MSRSRFKWQCFIICLLLLNTFTKSIPVYNTKLLNVITTDLAFNNYEVAPKLQELAIANSDIKPKKNNTESNNELIKLTKNLRTNELLRSEIRPDQRVARYAVEITDEGNSFIGRAIIDVHIGSDTRTDPIKFHVGHLNIQSVKASLSSEMNANNVDFLVNDGILEISPGLNALFYVLDIEYTGQYKFRGHGLYKGTYDGEGSYLGMNLHPTYARHVFPCMDEPSERSSIRFTYNNLDFSTVLTNSILEEGQTNQFRALVSPTHTWGMIAHNFLMVNVPAVNVRLFARPGLLSQDAQGSVAINSYFNNIQTWTNVEYGMIQDQEPTLNIVALPDVSTDWQALATIGIWEPNILMENNPSVKQRKTALFEIALAMSKQYFGYLVHVDDWRYQWVVSGLASYTAYEMMKLFQTSVDGNDVTILDINTLFVTDVIQESLLQDAYVGAQPLELSDNLTDENDIRDHINGLINIKAPALLRMMRIILGNPNQDFIQSAARSLLTRNTVEGISSLHLVDGINSEWLATGNQELITNVFDFLTEWMFIPGYPLIHVTAMSGSVLVTQQHFTFGQGIQHNFPIPITFTLGRAPNFVNYQPVQMLTTSFSLNGALLEGEWILFNIQGQGYYRVNYDNDLWENIIEALSDPDTRNVIHPLNRATLIDDALNLARAGKLTYDIALRVVLTMEHETEYAVWKAFVRNMEFLRKRLLPYVEENELDPDIYLRMVRRTIVTLEDTLGFTPEPNLAEPSMHTLTRGLMMEHACKANYAPCIAAAVDLFYDGDVVNPDIPHEIRPAVYCTMVREGDEDVINALEARMAIEPTLYERVVILESMACSQDTDFIDGFLQRTIAGDSPYSVEERNRIFAAIAQSSYANTERALTFIRVNTGLVIEMYGGLQKLEALITMLSDNMADDPLINEFLIWMNTQNNQLGDSDKVVQRAMLQVVQNQAWSNTHLENVYNWIDENDASTMVLSFAALCISIMVTLLNH